MKISLQKTDKQYKKQLEGIWGLDIDIDPIVGKFELHKNGEFGFFIACKTIQGKNLDLPDTGKPLAVYVPQKYINQIKDGQFYKFKVEFDALKKRIVKSPFLFILLDANTTEYEFNGLQQSNKISLEDLVNEIYKEKVYQNNPFNVIDLAEAVDSLAIDIYSENKRFIYELIQNADDAAIENNSEIVINITSDFVVVSHNGRLFNNKDLRGLCGIGRGTKRDDNTKTGYKGIGFKSVFGHEHGLVYVKSKDLLFRFDKQYVQENAWNSDWGDRSKWENENQIKFRAPWQLIPILTSDTTNDLLNEILVSNNFKIKTAIKINNSNELISDIQQLFVDARFLLFLRRINKIKLITAQGSEIIERVVNENDTLLLTRNGKTISHWIVKTWINKIREDVKRDLRSDSKSPKKIQEMENTELSFAFQLNDQQDGFELLKKNDSPIYTYLPTSVVEYELPFLVNSNFLVDAGREKLHKDRTWNQFLFKEIGYRLVKCCAEFAENGFSDTYLNILPADYYPETDQLKKSFNEGLSIGLEKEKIILNNNNEFALLSDILLDSSNLIKEKICSFEELTTYLNDTKGYNLESINLLIISDHYKKLIKYGVKEFTRSDLKEFLITNTFKDSISLATNFKLIKFLKTLDEESKSGEWNYLIRNNEYILDSSLELQKIPFVCFPTSNYISEFEEEIKVIHEKLYQELCKNDDTIKWLESLEVKSPSKIAYLEKEILAKFDEFNSDNYIQTTEFIVEAFKANELSKHHLECLQQMPVMLKSGKFIDANNSFLPAIYKPEIDFELILDDEYVLSEDYIGKYNIYDWNLFLNAIGVISDIEYKPKNILSKDFFEDVYVTKAIEFAKVGHSYTGLIKPTYSYYIQYITLIDYTTEFEFSKIFWNRLFYKYDLFLIGKSKKQTIHGKEVDSLIFKLNNSEFIEFDKMGWGYYSNNRVLIPSYVLWFIRSKKCIPTIQGVCEFSNNVYLNSENNKKIAGEYLPILSVAKEISKTWLELLGIKATLELEDLLLILSRISEDRNKFGKIKVKNHVRLGLVYKQLLDRIDGYSGVEENIITKWSNRFLHICDDFKVRNREEIYYLDIQGFGNYKDEIPSIYIPDDLKSHSNLLKLLKLLNIEIIDECDYQYVAKLKELSIKVEVLKILPYLSLILKSKGALTNINEFLFESLEKIKNFNFYSCEEIKLMLNHKGHNIEGASVPYHLTNEFIVLSGDWYGIEHKIKLSGFLSEILNCYKIKAEIQLLWAESESKISRYLKSVNLNVDELDGLESYSEINKFINELNSASNTYRAIENKTVIGEPKQIQELPNTKKVNESNTDDEYSQDNNGFREDVEGFINGIEGSEWNSWIPDLKNLLELAVSHPKEKQKLFNLIAKLKLAQELGITYELGQDIEFNQLVNGDEKYFVHSARGAFAYIHTNELLRMKNEGYKMALDFSAKSEIKIYHIADEIFELNINHLLLYQYEKSNDDLIKFCEDNKDANKHLLIVDRSNTASKSQEIFNLLNPMDDLS